MHSIQSKKSAIGAVAAVAVVALVAASGAHAQTKETVRIALLDPLSGTFANLGENVGHTFQFHVDRLNQSPTSKVRYELVTYDSKTSVQEAVTGFKSLTDQGIRYIFQGQSSAVALALADATAKYNERHPGKEVVYINYSSQDPSMNNEKCGYWHFNIESDTSMKMEAIGAYVADRPEIKKVYLINQNYGHGMQFSAIAKSVLKKRRPDIEIVGDDLHPIAQVKDFAPYVAKMRAAGADTVMSGNWGQDMTLLSKAISEGGLKATLIAPLAQGIGNAVSLASAGKGGEAILAAYAGNPNLQNDFGQASQQFTKKYGEFYGMPMIYQAFQLLPAAFAKAGSTDPAKFAQAMEGLTVPGINGDITMRASDHRLLQGVYISKFQKIDAKNPVDVDVDVEGSGATWATVKYFGPDVTTTPTTCAMKRPS